MSYRFNRIGNISVAPGVTVDCWATFGDYADVGALSIVAEPIGLGRYDTLAVGKSSILLAGGPTRGALNITRQYQMLLFKGKGARTHFA
jgi:hypothetical protein